jgi:hypothetical protein
MGDFEQATSSLCRQRSQHSDYQDRSKGAFEASCIHINTFLSLANDEFTVKSALEDFTFSI